MSFVFKCNSKWYHSDVSYTLNYYYYYYLICEAIGTVATPGLLCQPRVIVKIMEKQMECRLAGSRRKPAPAPLLSVTKSHMTRPCGGKLVTNRLSYGTAYTLNLSNTDFWGTYYFVKVILLSNYSNSFLCPFIYNI
jgi:hypothetical protein